MDTHIRAQRVQAYGALFLRFYRQQYIAAITLHTVRIGKFKFFRLFICLFKTDLLDDDHSLFIVHCAHNPSNPNSLN